MEVKRYDLLNHLIDTYGFVNYLSKEQYRGLIKNKRGKIDDAAFEESVVEVLKKNSILVRDKA